MSNRRRPRRTVISQYGIGTPAAVAHLAATYQCPDCTADVTRHPTPGVSHIAVAHDSTCPWWRALQASARRPS